MQEEILEPDLSYRNNIFTNEEMENLTNNQNGMEEEIKLKYNKNSNFSKLNINETRIIFNHKVNYSDVYWEEKRKKIYFSDGLGITFNELFNFNYEINDYNYNYIIDYLLPIDDSIFFYSYNNNDNEYSYVTRDWTFNEKFSNPYSTVGVFNFNPIYKFNEQVLYTFGLEKLFDRLVLINNNIDFYLNSVFTHIIGSQDLMEAIKNNIPNYFKEDNIKFSIFKNNFISNPIKYSALIQYYINIKNEGIPIFSELTYSSELFTKFNDLILNSNHLTAYGSKTVDPDEKVTLFENREGYFKYLVEHKEKSSIDFIDSDTFDYRNIINSLHKKDYGLFRGIYFDKDKDKYIKILFYIFSIKNKLNVDVSRLFNYFIDDNTDSEKFDNDYFNTNSEYSIIIRELDRDLYKLKEIFTNALIIKNYTTVINKDNINSNKIKHSIMKFDYSPLSGYLVYYGEEGENKFDLTEINRGNDKAFRFTKLNYIEGKSIVFDYRSIRITLSGLHGLNSNSETCRVYFDNVLISYLDEGLALSSVESNNYPYYVAYFIHSKKDFVRGREEPTSTKSVVRIEFKPEMNIPSETIEEQKITPFNEVFLEIFSSVFYIRADHFTNQFILVSEIKKENNRTFSVNPEEGVKAYYSINNDFSSNLIRVEKGNKIYNIPNDRLPKDDELYYTVESVNKAKKAFKVLKDDDEFNIKFKNFDNDFVIQKGTLEFDNNLKEIEEFELDDLLEVASNFKPKRKVNVTKKMIENEEFEEEIN